MRVIVTRPEREALRWVRDLSALGVEALALPLIRVTAVDDVAPLLRAWQQLGDCAAVMFVSANAVDHFFALKPDASAVFSAQTAIKTRAWATGPGTANALLRAGVAPQRLDAPAPDAGQFDSEALWQVVGAQLQPGQRVLIVRGGDDAGGSKAGPGAGREWFAQQVERVGARAEFLLAYQRGVPELGSAGRQLASQAASDGSVWLFSSAQALANLALALPGQSWTAARALATHPRIALAARKAGFSVVCESRPTLADVVASLKSCDELRA